MNDQAKLEAKKQLSRYLEKYHQIQNTSKSFNCINPDHTDGTPSMSIDPNDMDHVKCFGCGVYWDVFDIVKNTHNLSDDKEVFTKTYDLLGIIPEHYNTTGIKKVNETKKEAPPSEPTEDIKTESKLSKEQIKENIAYIEKCHERLLSLGIENSYFYKVRGLSEAVIKRFKLGHDPKHCIKEDTGYFWEAGIIPTANGSYMVRNTDPRATDKNRHKAVGDKELFNLECITSDDNPDPDKPIFITEGELDCLSILSVLPSVKAIALGSIANKSKLISFLKAKYELINSYFIVVLDNDQAGLKTSKDLVNQIRALDIPAYEYIIPDVKDHNEALITDPRAYKNNLLQVQFQYSTKGYEIIHAFTEHIKTNAETKPIPTGFKYLDDYLDGGMYEGLYTIGGISALGKTAFALQIADQQAKAGQPVLIFSLEMSKFELIARSISRLTAMNSSQFYGGFTNASTARQITRKSEWDGYKAEQKELIRASIGDGAFSDKKEYERYFFDYGKNINIYEGVYNGSSGRMGVNDIISQVDKYMLYNSDKKPVVIIDYLQILKPYDPRATDKQAVDEAVTRLKADLSRRYKIPVLIVSSLNRENYNQHISLKAFKESGAIEYSSDVIFGIEFQAMDNVTESTKNKPDMMELIKKEPRDINLKILKNRQGRTGGVFPFGFYAKYSYFVPEEPPASNN